MTVREADRIIRAPFATLEAYTQAETFVLERLATKNQRALYAIVKRDAGPEGAQGFLCALLDRTVGE